MAKYAINCAERGRLILLLCFSIDRAEIIEALIEAHQRGCRVRVGADYNMTMYGRTRDQVQSLRRLTAAGVEVLLIQGVPLGPVYRAAGRECFGNLKGIQHSKGLLVGKRAFIGSSNWTTSTRANHEITMMTSLHDEEQLLTMQGAFVSILACGRYFSSDQGEAAARSRSSSARVGKTQSRFITAREE